MPNVLSKTFRNALPLGLGLMFLLAVACGSPAATSETAPPPAGSAPAATAPRRPFLSRRSPPPLRFRLRSHRLPRNQTPSRRRRPLWTDPR